MANPMKAEFDVIINGTSVKCKLSFDVMANVERATGFRLVTAMNAGGLGFGELQQIVYHAARETMGGLTLKTSNRCAEGVENRGIMIRVLKVVVEFFSWHMSETDEEQAEMGEATEVPSGTGETS